MDNIFEYLNDMKNIQASIVKYIENDDDPEENFNNLIKLIDIKKMRDVYQELKPILYLISAISNSHHRTTTFFMKISQIFEHLKMHIQQTYKNSEIFDIFKDNKLIILILIEQNIITMDKYIFSEIEKIDKQNCDFNYKFYFSKEVKQFLNKPLSNENEDNYDEKRRVGENDNYICELIRKDLVEDFITFITQKNFPLSSTIESSLFETNRFLYGKNPTLIEYAAFFGSIQIFQYLKLNNVELKQSLWIFAIHGENNEMIHILEENNVKPVDESFCECLLYSIECHRDDIMDYIINNLMPIGFDEKKKNDLMLLHSLKCHNYSAIPDNLDNNTFLYYLCKYNYFTLVYILLQNKEIDINALVIL